MTVSAIWTVWCDGDHTGPEFAVKLDANPRAPDPGPCPRWVAEEDSPSAARSLARHENWKRIAGKDYSPYCAGKDTS